MQSLGTYVKRRANSGWRRANYRCEGYFPFAPSTTQGVKDRKQAALTLKLGDFDRVPHSHESFESYHLHCT